MLFYTPEFLFFSIYLLAVLSMFNRGEPRKIVLLIASYVFYMWWNPAYIFLILFATAVNYFLGARLEREESPARRKALLTTSLVLTLGVLAYFKYIGFLDRNALALAQFLGFRVSWTVHHVEQVVGISFFTFQTLSYTIDVYRRKLPACRSPLDFALFVAFFPQLVAGPIVRAADFLPQLQRPTTFCFDRIGFFMIVRGLAKKVLVADNLGVFVDSVFGTTDSSGIESWPSIIIWIAAVCFYAQIYCDFSGYSDIAIGVARVLGFHLTKNFDRPYFSSSPADFWHRWHISLSTWLRDYLYIPLGGNRHGTLMTGRNLMLTMLLGGLWHGPSWNFVLWGFLHGTALIIHRVWLAWKWQWTWEPPRIVKKLRTFVCWVAMQYFVLLTWIAFRIVDTESMLLAMRKFVFFDFNFSIANLGLGAMGFFTTLILLVSFLVLHTVSWLCEGLDRKLAEGSMWLAVASCIPIGMAFFFFWPLEEIAFIYFQF